MSWSTRSIAWPSSARPRSRAPSSSLSRVSRPAAGSSRHTTRGFGDERPRDPDQLALSLRQLARAIAPPCPRARAAPGRASISAECGPGAETVSRIVRQADVRCEATSRFSPTERSSNSSIDCHVRARPRRARTCGGAPVRSSPSSSTRPSQRTKPLIASMNVVLPAPFGPIRPTSCPSPTSRSTSTTAWTPPNRTEIPVAFRTGVIAPAPGGDASADGAAPLAPEVARRATVRRTEEPAEVLRARQAPPARDRQDRLVVELGIEQVPPAALEPRLPDPAADTRALRLEQLVQVPGRDEARPRDLGPGPDPDRRGAPR